VSQILVTPAMSDVQAQMVLTDLGLHFLTNWAIWALIIICLAAIYRKSTRVFWGIVVLGAFAAAVYVFAPSLHLNFGSTASECTLATTNGRFCDTPEDLAPLIQRTTGAHSEDFGDCVEGAQDLHCWLFQAEQIGIIVIAREWDSEIVNVSASHWSGDPEALSDEHVVFSRVLPEDAVSWLMAQSRDASATVQGFILEYLKSPDGSVSRSAWAR
jgi:hypothetical protein